MIWYLLGIWFIGFIVSSFFFYDAIHTESDDRYYAEYPEAEIAPGDMVTGLISIIWPISVMAVIIWKLTERYRHE